MEILDRLHSALARFKTDPETVKSELTDLAEKMPQEFRTAALTWITHGNEEVTGRFLVEELYARNMLVEALSNPAAMPMEDAVKIAAQAQATIPGFDVDLARECGNPSAPQAARATSLLMGLKLSNEALTALTGGLRHQDAAIRSMAAKLYAGISRDKSRINYLVNDEDPRVRANTLEGLRSIRGALTTTLLRDALADDHHRVAANAALGLYELGHSDGAGHLRAMTTHSEREHRISAAWAIGETGDKSLALLLDAMASDQVSSVRSAAQAAARKLRGETPKLTVRPWFESDGKRCVVRAVVRDLAGEVIADLSKESFEVLDGGEEIAGFEFVAPQQRKPLALSYVLDSRSDLDQAGRSAIDAALLASLEARREGDLFRVYRFSDLIESAVGFGADIERLRQALARPHNGGGRALRVFDAVSEALDTIVGETGRDGHIVLLSSGVDRGSKARLDQVARVAREAGVSIHGIAFGAEADRRALKLLASKTSGLFQSVKTPSELDAAFDKVFSALANCFHIYYQRAAAPVSEIKLVVKCDQGEGVGCCGDPASSARKTGVRLRPAYRRA